MFGIPGGLPARPQSSRIRRPAARIALLLATALVGCEHPKAPVVTMLPPLPGETATAPLRINGNVGSPQVPAPPLISYGTPPSTAVPAPPEGAAGGDISLDFADTDIREVVTQIMGTILRLNYTIDPAVHGTATLRTQQPLARSQLLPVLQSLLAEDGAALVQAGSLYRIVPIAQAAAAAAEAGTSGTAPVVLRYASAEDLAKVLQPFVGDGGKIAADPAHNILLVSGSPDTRDGLIGLIQLIRRGPPRRPFLRAAAGRKWRREGFRQRFAGCVPRAGGAPLPAG